MPAASDQPTLPAGSGGRHLPGGGRNDVLADIVLDLPERREGKVRVGYTGPDGDLVFVTTDRLSAFDRILACVPRKGQVLNQLSAWWFDRTTDIVANHVVAVPDPNVTIARPATPLPIEVVVRGYITGVTDTSLWSMYAHGDRTPYGHRLPDGLVKNSRLPAPIVTPTTKAASGEHDTPLDHRAVVDDGHLPAARWEQVRTAALGLFARATEVGAAAGLLIADTKYEFGVDADGALILIDEVHTPDSSRWWVAATYAERLAAGAEPESLDKEVVRHAYADLGYTGSGPVPEVPDEVWSATSVRYVDAFERLTGTTFTPGATPIADRVRTAVAAYFASADPSPPDPTP